MSRSRMWTLASMVVVALAGTTLVATAAHAASDSPDACLNGYVWREAIPTDHVCVTNATRTATAYDNSQANARRNPAGGPYGPDTCLNGYVWREAYTGDHVCVTPTTRSNAANDNSQASNRKALLSIWYTHWTVPPQCSGDICSIGSTDSIGRFYLSGDHFNFGSVYVGLFRSSDGSPISTATVTARAQSGYVAGAWGFKVNAIDCGAIGAPITNNAFLIAFDNTSQRWSDRIYVTIGCPVL